MGRDETKGRGVVEGKRWYALYLTPKVLKIVVDLAMVVLLIALMIALTDFYHMASSEMDTAIAEGLVPEIVKKYALSCMGLLIVPMLAIFWLKRR